MKSAKSFLVRIWKISYSYILDVVSYEKYELSIF